MKRKVFRVGPATHVVSLPSKWMRENGVKRGDELSVEDNGKSLIIGGDKKEELKSIKLNLLSSNRFMARSITNLYTRGYDEIILIFQERKILEKIEHVANQLIGFEIVNVDRGSCTLKCISTGIEQEFETILNRLFLIIIMMGERCVEYISIRDKNELNKNVETELITNRYSLFCERILNKKGYKEPEKKTYLFTMIWALEQVADRLLSISELLIEECNVGLSPKTEELTKATIRILRAYYKLFKAVEYNKMFEIKKSESLARKAILNSLHENTENNAVLVHLANILLLVQHLTHITF